MPSKTQVQLYKEQVGKAVRKYQKEHDLCEEGVQEFAKELGLELPPNKVKVLLTLSSINTFEIEVEMGPDNDYYARLAAAQSLAEGSVIKFNPDGSLKEIDGKKIKLEDFEINVDDVELA